jgi:MPBQ/MSBQ methyltransferase
VTIVKREGFLGIDGLGLDLFFCSEILKLSSLHYGLWDDPRAEPLTLDSLRHAQARYTHALLDLVPQGVERVLDVGCGLGDVAQHLAARGYAVTAISPDRNHRRYLLGIDDVTFVQARYQTFECSELYDLVLMSESQNYFQADTCFERTARHLKPAGHLLVSGMFRKRDGEPFPDHVNRIDAFIDHGRSSGFELIEDIDVTQRVLPTLELIHGALGSYVTPSVDLLRHFFAASAPMKARAIAWLFKKQLRELEAIHRFLLRKTDPVRFARHGCYRMLLFRRVGGRSA